MVTEFGMSKLGPISIGEGGGNPFLGRQMATGHQVGSQLANDIDSECRRIVQECLESVKALIVRDQECFQKIVDVLMVKETILGPEFRQLRNESACAVVLPSLDDSTAGKPASSTDSTTNPPAVAPTGDDKGTTGSGNAQ